MEPVVLVAYATRTGSTAELAYTVGEIVREHGMKADVLPVREIRSVLEYNAVVLVAALYIGRLHRDARHFLERYRQWLKEMPVELFVPGPVRNAEKDFVAARQQLEKQLERFPWLSPVAAHVVGGVGIRRTWAFPGR